MSSPPQTTTSSSSPPANFMSAYDALMKRATGIANQPLQQYSGPIVAGLSSGQQDAINNINDAQGIANPFINSAAQAYGQAMTPLTTNAPQIADAYGSQATGIAGQAGGDANSAAAQGVGIAQAGAIGNAAKANQSAGTDIWSQVGPVTNQQIQKYESPYTQQVVNATQAQFNNQNQQTNQGIIGNAISKGAWGGDRAGVAQGIAAGQEALAQAPVIAGLQNQGYSQALGEANTQQALQANLGSQKAALGANTALGAGNLLSSTGTSTGQLGANTALGAGQLGANTALGAGNLGIAGAGQKLQADQASAWLAMQGGQGLAGLGQEAQSTALQGAAAQMGAGNLEQSVNQAQLNVPYQQFMQQQQYPFQSTQWLTSLLQGLGSSAGGQSSTTSPGPSGLSQGIGAIGGLASIASLFLKSGGAVKRASGGGIDAPDLSLQFIPDYKSGIAQGGGPPKPPNPAEEQDDMSGIGGLVDAFGKVKGKLKKGKLGGDGLPGEQDFQDAFSDKFGDIDTASAGPASWQGATPDALIAHAGYKHGGIAQRADGGRASIEDPEISAGSGGASGIIKLPKTSSTSRGINIPQLSVGTSHATAIDPKLTKDYGNAAADENGKSTLPSTTYYPNVDPWFSENPANVTKGDDGKTKLKPGITNPTNTNIETGISPDFDYNALINQLSMAGFKSGGGIARYAGGGDVDDDSYVPAEALDDSDDVGVPNGIASVSRGTLPSVAANVTGGKPFATHPIEKQPEGNALPDAPEPTGIASKGDKPTYTPRKAVDVKDQPEGKDAAKLAFLAASLGIMAGKSPNALQNIGAGGLEGLKEYTTLRGKAADRAEKQAEAEDTGNYRVKSLSDAMDRWQGTLNETKDFHTKTGEHQTNQDLAQAARDRETVKYHARELAKGNFEYVGPSKDDPTKGVYLNKNTGQQSMGPLAGSKTGAASNPDYVQTRAEAIANYKEKPMSAFERKTDDGKEIEKVIHQMNPDYSETYFPAAVTARTKFASGQQGNTVKSFNVSLSHLATLDALRDALGAGNVQLVNSIKQKLSEEFGGTAITDYNTAHKMVMDEATKAVIGAAGTGGDREEYNKTAAAAQAASQGNNAANTMRALMVGHLKGLQKQYEFGTRAHDFEDMLDDDAKSLLHNNKFAPGKNPNKPDVGGGGAAPSAASIQYLKANPGTAAKFDEHFGPGASKQYLGGP